LSKVEVNEIDKQSGSTLTLGGSGTAVTLACGATQSGFGRTGTVDWQTTIKTGSFTAANGEGYFVDTSSGGVTVTLPSSPSAGNIIAVKDYANTADTNRITFNRNGSNIDGSAANAIVSKEGGAVTLVYADATKGWLVTDAAQKSDIGFPTFIAATGGTVTTVCTDFKVHTFTGPGTFCVSAVGNACGSNTVDYLVIAGGGGGGHGQACYQSAGGGGAGGYRESPGTASGNYTVSPLGVSPAAALPVTATGFPIVVGGGGAGAPASQAPNPGGSSGSVSSFSTISSAGGGGASGYCGSIPNTAGAPGGSGGGNGTVNDPSPGFTPLAVATGNQPPVTPPQGNPGGRGTQTPFGGPHSGGGGGGATGAGADGSLAGPGGNGGAAGTSSINGTPTARAGGGGGSSCANTGGTTTGGGGAGGGTPLGPDNKENGTAGTANTGGGGGGGTAGAASGNAAGGGTGGSGIVIIRYKFQ
jgi:hypothetical protein